MAQKMNKSTILISVFSSIDIILHDEYYSQKSKHRDKLHHIIRDMIVVAYNNKFQEFLISLIARHQDFIKSRCKDHPMRFHGLYTKISSLEFSI